LIWFITNTDTEVLALRAAVEALPDGFDQVRAGQTWVLDRTPVSEMVASLDGARAVIIRLMRGRRAWEERFDALRAGCLRRGIAFLASAGRPCPTPR
jgi:cobaltochelatase CobN